MILREKKTESLIGCETIFFVCVKNPIHLLLPPLAEETQKKKKKRCLCRSPAQAEFVLV